MRIRGVVVDGEHRRESAGAAHDRCATQLDFVRSMTVLIGPRGEARAALAQVLDAAAVHTGPSVRLAAGLEPRTCLITADDLDPNGPGASGRRSSERDRLVAERAHLEGVAGEYRRQIAVVRAERGASSNPLALADELLQAWRTTAERTACRRLMASSLLAAWPAPPAADPVPSGPDPRVLALARRRVERSRQTVERLHDTAQLYALAAGDCGGLEAIHAAIEDGERSFQRRRRASSEARIAHLRTQEHALLDHLGFSSWPEYRLASRATTGDTRFTQQVRQAEATLRDAQDHVDVLLGKSPAAASDDPTLDPLRRRARGVLADESQELSDPKLVDGLRAILSDTGDVDAARVALEHALDAAGAPPSDPAVRYDALLAETTPGELPWRSPDAEDALARDEELVTLEAALGETREQISILDAHVALAARHAPTPAELTDGDVELVMLRQASVLRRDGYPLVVDEALTGRPETLVRTVLATLEDLSREIQVIFVTEEPAVVSWARGLGRARVSVVDLGATEDWTAEEISTGVHVVVEAGTELDLTGSTPGLHAHSTRERCRRCWAIEVVEHCVECRRQTCKACLVGPTRFHGRLCVDCALVAAGVRSRRARR